MSLSLNNRHLAILGIILLAVIAARLIIADTGTTPLNPGHPLSQTWIDTNLNLGAYNLYTLGNVGIGTASPGAKLDVAGNIKIADGTQGAGKVLISDANGLASWQTVSAGVPSGFCIFSDTQSSCPAGWTRRTQFDGRTVRGDATPGGTGGSDTHSHSGSTRVLNWGSEFSVITSIAASSSWPPYTNVLICCKN